MEGSFTLRYVKWSRILDYVEWSRTLQLHCAISRIFGEPSLLIASCGRWNPTNASSVHHKRVDSLEETLSITRHIECRMLKEGHDRGAASFYLYCAPKAKHLHWAYWERLQMRKDIRDAEVFAKKFTRLALSVENYMQTNSVFFNNFFYQRAVAIFTLTTWIALKIMKRSYHLQRQLFPLLNMTNQELSVDKIVAGKCREKRLKKREHTNVGLRIICLCRKQMKSCSLPTVLCQII